MKRSYFLSLLTAEAALCLALGLLGWGMGSDFFSIQAFPFAQLGQGLRKLSALGRWGNAGAIFLYPLVGLLTVGLNLAQVLLFDRLYDVGVSLYLPVYGLSFLLLLLLFTRCLGESRQLKEENDLFI